MPVYELPKLKTKEKDIDEDEMPAVAGSTSEQQFPDEWDRRIRIPVNEEILEQLKVGEKATITLYGNIEETTSRKNDKQNAMFLEVMISKVDAYPESETMEEEYGAMESEYKDY